MNSIYQTKTPEETMDLGKQLAARLISGSVILLFGDLGTGKTHFTKGLAKGLDIDETIKSPTFTYVNSYKISSGKRKAVSEKQKKLTAKLTAYRLPLFAFHHYDLYRLSPGEPTYSIGLEETLNDPQAINVIEWADRLGESLPKDYIRVDLKAHSDSHEIQIQFHNSQVVPENLVEAFWDEWMTPIHVRVHCQQVAKVAVQIGEALVKKNILIDLNSVRVAALLHDMARVCDFNALIPESFKEEITEEKWNRWLSLREEFKGQHHPDIAHAWLSEKKYLETAELIRLHNSLSILQEAEEFERLEVALVYYADKRVKHDEIVSLAERFEDGRERYGDHDDENLKELYLEVEKVTFELEKRLFDRIDLEPSGIK